MLSLEQVIQKTKRNERLSPDDALLLFKSKDLLTIGELANLANEKINSNVVFYNINRHINPTNICVMSCKFCSFAKKPGELGAYEYTLSDIMERVEKAVKNEATEIHMVGGLHPRWSFDHYLKILGTIRESYPRIHLKAFTAVEVDWFAKKSRLSVERVLEKLKNAGLNSMPGGGAEIFAQNVRRQITAKLSTERWLSIHRKAHQVGLESNCTMLYGHIESYEDRVEHLFYLRNLQDETGGFNSFIPLSFQPDNNKMGIKSFTSGFDDLKVIAISRLFLDNFKHIKAYWMMLGPDIAQIATSFGANDLDGTIVEEKISNMAGSQSGMSLTRRKLEHLIIKAKKSPIERDSLYNVIGKVNSGISTLFGLNERQEDIELTLEDSSLEDSIRFIENNSIFSLMSYDRKRRRKRKIEQDNLITFSFVVDVTLEDNIETLVTRYKTNLESGQSFCFRLDVALYTKHEDNLLSNWDKLTYLIKELKIRYKSVCIIVSGFQFLWQIAQIKKIKLFVIFSELVSLGVQLVESSSHEFEGGLTNSEIVGLHKEAHMASLPTIAKIELNTHLDGNGFLWKPLLSRINSYLSLQKQTNGFKAFMVEPAHDASMTVYEFLYAISVVKFFLGDDDKTYRIIAPFGTWPLFMKNDYSFAKKLDTAVSPFNYFAQDKLLSLLCFLGVNDFGHFSLLNSSENFIQSFARNLEICGYEPCVRDALFSSKHVNIRKKILSHNFLSRQIDSDFLAENSF